MVKTGSKGDVKQTQDKWKDADWARLLQRNEIQLEIICYTQLILCFSKIIIRIYRQKPFMYFKTLKQDR